MAKYYFGGGEVMSPKPLGSALVVYVDNPPSPFAHRHSWRRFPGQRPITNLNLSLEVFFHGTMFV